MLAMLVFVILSNNKFYTSNLIKFQSYKAKKKIINI